MSTGNDGEVTLPGLIPTEYRQPPTSQSRARESTVWIAFCRFFHNESAGRAVVFQILASCVDPDFAPDGTDLLFATLLNSSRLGWLADFERVPPRDSAWFRTGDNLGACLPKGGVRSLKQTPVGQQSPGDQVEIGSAWFCERLSPCRTSPNFDSDLELAGTNRNL